MSVNGRRSPRGYIVRDRAQLAMVVAELVSALGRGHARLTAERLGLSAPMLSVLRHEQRARISAETYRALSRGIYELRKLRGIRQARPEITRLLTMLAHAVTYPTQDVARRDAYDEWCAERAEQLIRRRGDRWELGDDGPVLVRWSEQLDGDGAAPLVDEAPSISRVVELLRRDEYWRLLLRLDAPGSRTRADLRGFASFCEKRRPPVSAARRLVALVRIVEPLLEVAESGLLERRWQDLDDRQLSAFVSHGVMREKLLLR